LTGISSLLKSICAQKKLFQGYPQCIRQQPYSRIDIILLKKYSSLEQVGLNSLAMQIAEQLWYVPYAIDTIVLTRSANATDEKFVSKTVASIFRVSFLIRLFGCLLIFVQALPLLPIIFGEEFKGSVHILQPLLLGMM
jgi:O-antigen/teichoic acid export membrane protein